MICFSVVAPILPIELNNINFEKEHLGYNKSQIELVIKY